MTTYTKTGLSWMGNRGTVGGSYPEPDWVATFESDAGASNGANVLTFTTGKYGFGQTYKFGYNSYLGQVIDPVIEPKYRTPGTNGAPVVRKRNGQLQALLGEVTIRGGDQTSSGDDASRMEMGLSTSNRTSLLPKYGETEVLGGALYLDPSNWAWENNPGQDINLTQLPKGDDPDPYLNWTANDDGFQLYMNYAVTVIWDSGLTYSQLRGHLLRWMLRVYYHENDGTVEAWFALDANELTKQNLLNTDPNPDATVWQGDTMLASETSTSCRHRIGHYGDSPYDGPETSIHRLWWTGIETMKTTDPDMVWAVEPPTLEA